MKLIVYGMGIMLLVTGCVGSQPAATSTPSLTPAPTFTSQPTEKNTPTETPDAVAGLLPHGRPVSEWNGIPIMSSAIEGESDAESYRFTTAASQQEIRAYYQSELAKQGWELLGAGEGEMGAVILIFTAGDGSLTISILPSESISIVMIIM